MLCSMRGGLRPNSATIIVDLDGTLALGRFGDPGRRGPFDWGRVGEDDQNPNVIKIVSVLSRMYTTIIVSGRSMACCEETMGWLKREAPGVMWDSLYMRRDGDFRPDEIVKEDIYRSSLEGVYDVVAVFDDRDKVVNMWRDLGLTCMQVAPGDF
jgi:hypothetical protein